MSRRITIVACSLRGCPYVGPWAAPDYRCPEHDKDRPLTDAEIARSARRYRSGQQRDKGAKP